MALQPHQVYRHRYTALAATAALAILLMLIGADSAQAQADGARKVEADTATPQVPHDEFNRGTPRTSFIGFSQAAQRGDYEEAAQYLDLRDDGAQLREIDGPELAEQFMIVLNRYRSTSSR